MARAVFWIPFTLCVCISILTTSTPSGLSRTPSSYFYIELVKSVAEGVIWGLVLGSLSVLGLKIYHKLKK